MKSEERKNKKTKKKNNSKSRIISFFGGPTGTCIVLVKNNSIITIQSHNALLRKRVATNRQWSECEMRFRLVA